METYTIDNLICRVIVRNNDYSKGIKEFKKIEDRNFNDSMKINKQKDNFTYEKITQIKRLIVLYQLFNLNYNCSFCGNPVLLGDEIIISHNYGHKENYKYNVDLYSELDFSYETILELCNKMFKQHKMHSLFHKLCNHKHFDLKDTFESLKLEKELTNILFFNYIENSKNIVFINFGNTLKNIIKHYNLINNNSEKLDKWIKNNISFP